MSFNLDRVKRVYVSEHALLALFSPLGQCVALRLNHPKLPADARVLSVHHDYSRRAICAIVHSAEWPECRRGAELEVFDDPAEVMVEVRYVQGDRLTPYMRHIDQVRDLTPEEREARERSKSEQFRDLANAGTDREWEKATVSTTTSIKAGDPVQTNMGLGIAIPADGVPLMREGKQIGTAAVDSDGVALLSITDTEAAAMLKDSVLPIDSAGEESARDWFRRIMS